MIHDKRLRELADAYLRVTQDKKVYWKNYLVEYCYSSFEVSIKYLRYIIPKLLILEKVTTVSPHSVNFFRWFKYIEKENKYLQLLEKLKGLYFLTGEEKIIVIRIQKNWLIFFDHEHGEILERKRLKERFDFNETLNSNFLIPVKIGAQNLRGVNTFQILNFFFEFNINEDIWKRNF